MRLPTSRAFVGWLALILATHFYGSKALCAQIQSLLQDQSPQDGETLSATTANGLAIDGFPADSSSLPNGPSVNDDSAFRRQSVPYDSLRLRTPNFDDDNDLGYASISAGNEITFNGMSIGAVHQVYRHSPIRKHSQQGDDLSFESEPEPEQ